MISLSKFKYLKLFLPTFILVWLGLFIDSKELSQSFSYNQWLTNILVIGTYIFIYLNVNKRVKKIMIYGFFLALLGEILFSLILGMYTYRLENLPLYVPFGHTIVYVAIFYLSKEPIIRNNQNKLIPILYYSMIIFSTFWLIYQNDVLGFICMIFILILFKKKSHTKLFYLLMFFMVLYLELVGTYYGCWYWPEIWFDKVPLIPSANPPSSISFFYFGFDAGCLWLYKQFHLKQWNRMKNIRVIKAKKHSL